MKKITLFLFLLSLVTTISIEAQITTFPYTEDFESGDGGWVANNTSNGTWALGTPTGAIINSAASGSNSWVTNLSGTYNTSENSWVTSPVFNFSSLAAPSIELNIWYDSEFSYDGAVLQSSIDGGSTWNNVGANGDSNNWYTDNTIGGSPGGQSEGWSGTGTAGTNAWVIARHALTGLGGESNVIFRIAFGSDFSIVDEGFGFDDINIFEVICPEPTDIAITNITETTADISWSPGGAETLWDLEWGISGFTPGSGTIEAGLTTTSFSLTSLTLSTTYDVYIVSDCQSLGTSTVVGPIIFNTQVPGGSCASALPMAVEVDCDSATPITFDFSIAEDTVASGENPSCDAFDNYGYWISFTAPAIGSVVINFDGAADSIGLQVFESCGGTEVSECNDNFLNAGDDSGVIGGLTPGDTYYAVIWSDTQSGSADVCIEEGPTCPYPINLEATNLTESTADLSWSENGAATSWNIEWGISGFTPGTGTMINNVTTNPYSLSGLEPDTEYDFYVQAICTSETSDFAGPLTFLTMPQTNFTIDCGVGPLTQDYCYDNNDINVFTFTSNDGTPLNLTFNSGFVENIYDELVAIDSDGLPFDGYAPEDDNYGNEGNIAGLTFQSTGDTISFYINSDTSNSCSDGYNTGINYTVSCATCINPQATFAVIDDCNNGEQFLIDIAIDSLGDASSLTITNNIDGDAIPVTETGTYQMGPFPFLQDVIISVSNDQDFNCLINSQVIQLLDCPPENNNPCSATIAFVNDDILCAQSTPGTLLGATPTSNIADPSCGGNADDDVWFQFEAQSEYQLISLANISGSDTSLLAHALYEGTCDNLNEIACVELESDFFSEDLPSSSATPQLVIGNTYFIRIFSYNDSNEDTTFDLCITPYVAPINLQCDLAENYCSGSDASDILYTYNTIGLDGGAGSIGCLSETPNPTYSVLEVGTTGEILIEMVQNTAFDANDNPIGDGLDVDFILWGPFAAGEDLCNLSTVVDCSYSAAPVENVTLTNAQAGEIYLLLITNYARDAGVIQVRQTNVGGADAGSTIADINASIVSDDAYIDPSNDDNETDIVSLCGYTSLTIETNSPFADDYIWFKDGDEIAGENSSELTITESGVYQVQAFDSQCNSNALSQLVDISLYNSPDPLADLIITRCPSSDGNGTVAFDLDEFSASLGLDGYTITYYTSLADANPAVNAVTSPYTSAGETLIMRIEDTAAFNDGYLGCRQLPEVELVVSGTAPVINDVEDFIVCDDLDGTVDGFTEFDLASNNALITSDTNINVTYHTSLEDADVGANALTSPYTSGGETIYVRAEDATTGCYETTSFNLVINVVPLASFDPQYNYIVCPEATSPITIGIAPENFTATDVTISWEFNGVSVPGNGLTLDTVLLAGDYTAIIEFNNSTCTNPITITVEQAEICEFPEGISPNNDGKNDAFDLRAFDVTKLEIFNRYGTKVYSKNNYTNEWKGQTDDGEELPVGTYFYTVIYEGGAKSKSAWVYINR
ncbi:gliding motility-associated C-terminal domain-containing protein [Winogradskyella wichelsiae]|uniref:T9SS type B sorting domain-containing protein n=1 Tax=Winogradskyella wichelsiae TaxID=2697007 RepID=UPI003EFB3438